jgi:phage terminase large subunit
MSTELILRTPDGRPFVPLPGQADFFRSPAKYRAIIAGLGHGKSMTGVVELLMTALLYPGAQCAMVRWDFSSLRGSTWKTMLDILEASGLSPLIKAQTNSPQGAHVELTNGSLITARHGKKWEQFGSFQFDAAFLEEAHEVPTSECWDSLAQRLRGHVGPLRLWMTGLSDGHNWAWERFVKQEIANHELFRGTTRQNPFLPSTYADEQYATLGKDRALLLMEGSFDAVEGRCLEMFNPRIHVIPRRSLPREYPRYCSVDPGFDDPAALVRACVTPNGSIIIEDFYEESGKTTEQFTREMLARCQHPKPMWWVVDPSADRNTHLSPVSVLQTMRQGGMGPLRTGNNDVGQSIARLRSLLTPDPNHCHPFTGERGAPKLYIFEDLSRLIWEVQNLRWVRAGAATAMTKPRLNDRDVDGVDALRYLVMEHLTPASEAAPPPMSDFWRQVLEQETQDRPYIEQIGAKPRGR